MPGALLPRHHHTQPLSASSERHEMACKCGRRRRCLCCSCLCCSLMALLVQQYQNTDTRTNERSRDLYLDQNVRNKFLAAYSATLAPDYDGNKFSE